MMYTHPCALPVTVARIAPDRVAVADEETSIGNEQQATLPQRPNRRLRLARPRITPLAVSDTNDNEVVASSNLLRPPEIDGGGVERCDSTISRGSGSPRLTRFRQSIRQKGRQINMQMRDQQRKLQVSR